MQMLRQDFRYAARLLRKNPGFSLIAILTLAVGIGANTALFSAAEAVFLRALPYNEADRLMFLSSSFPNTTTGNDNMSYTAFADWQAQSQSFERMALYHNFSPVTLTGREDAVRLNTNFITADYFAIFNVNAVRGRLFTTEEMRVPGNAPVAVISHACWQSVFGGDEAIIGKSIAINQAPLTIIGVMQPEFTDLEDPEHPGADIWLPMNMTASLLNFRLEQRSGRLFFGVARIKSGVTLAATKAEANAIAQRLGEAHPVSDKGFGLFVETLRDHFYRDLYNPVRLLLLGSACVLLIGCVNVANLLLARVAGRRREMAVRAALGATRGQLLRQMLVESLLLALIAGALGLLLASWAASLLNSWEALQLPGFVTIRLNGLVLAVSLGLSLLTGLLFGLLPAWQGARADLREMLNQSGKHSAALERNWSRRLLVCAEVALSFVLLIGAGLMLKSVWQLSATGLGFRTENLLTLRMDLTAAKYAQPEARAQFAEQLLEKAQQLPGVETATLWGPASLGRASWVMFVAPEGQPINGQADLTTTWRHSTNSGGLRDLGLSLLSGRDFTTQDNLSAPHVAIISESLARRFWPNQDVLGKRFVRQSPTGLVATTVIGVAADAQQRRRYLPDQGADWAFRPQLDIYLPYAQRPNPQLVMALRTKHAEAQTLPAFRQAVQSLDRDLTMYDVMTLDTQLTRQAGTPRAIATLMFVYAAVALFLATLGLYGVLAHSVAERTQELGIRIALGAQTRDIFGLVMGQGLRLIGIGLGVGVLAAFGATRLMQNLLFGVSATDPLIFVGIAALLAGVAFLACWLPARRATKVDPMIALRCD